jgi:hypothetical protein
MVKYFKFARVLLFLFLMIGFSDAVHAKTQLLEDAGRYYEEGQYERAGLAYQTLLESNSYHSGLLFNVGNSFLKQDQIGKSITYYKKALKWSPGNSKVADNLAFARKKIIDDISTDKKSLFQPVNKVVSRYSFNSIFWGFIVISFLLNGLFFMYLRGSRGEVFKNILWVVVGLFVVISLVFGIKSNDEFFVTKGVIVVNKASVRIGPSTTLETLFFVHDGVEFEVINEIENWVELKLSSGLSGWVIKDSFWVI